VRRSVLRTYQLAARIWLTAAALALVLPHDVRLGLWLPVHLALAGAVSVAISGAMQNFAVTLSAAPDPPPRVVWTQFAAVNLGAGLVALGRAADAPALVAAGGTLFVVAALLLGWLVARARRIGLNRRHALPFAMYGSAIAAVVVGGTLGAIVGVAGPTDAEVWLRLRAAHPALNVLGWASLTIVGTLVTFLPTVLRARMPAWRGRTTGALLAAGVATIGLGLGSGSETVAALGGSAFALGALGIAWMAALALRTPRPWPVPLAAKHLLAALAWFVAGSLALPWMLATGFPERREPFLVVFVAGWVLQTLLGAWLYLLPMARPGHPDERRRWLAAIEAGGTSQVVVANAGVALWAWSVLGSGQALVGRLGTALALGAAAVALGKAWAFPALANVQAFVRRHARMWGA
jgi:nitrite reductase (NO-forming)